jgi:uncharacterized coiled-coil protein SlyX
MKKKIIIGTIIVFIFAVAACGFYYFKVYKENTGLLNDLDKILKEVETNVGDESITDESITTEVSNDVTEDEDSLDELESELDIVLSKLDEIESAESALGTEVE